MPEDTRRVQAVGLGALRRRCCEQQAVVCMVCQLSELARRAQSGAWACFAAVSETILEAVGEKRGGDQEEEYGTKENEATQTRSE